MKFNPNPEYRLMDQVREVLRYYYYAYRTEQSYSSWILQYIKFYAGYKDAICVQRDAHDFMRFYSFLKF
jgi:hypothetical protein